MLRKMYHKFVVSRSALDGPPVRQCSFVLLFTTVPSSTVAVIWKKEGQSWIRDVVLTRQDGITWETRDNVGLN